MPEGVETCDVPKEAQLFVGPPTEECIPFETRFTDLFVTIPEVLEASFIQIADDSRMSDSDVSTDDPLSNSRFLLGLRLEPETRDVFQRVAQQVARSAEGILTKGKSMDITLMNGSLKEAFEKYGKKFYVKKTA